jgi:hypothetical protein
MFVGDSGRLAVVAWISHSPPAVPHRMPLLVGLHPQHFVHVAGVQRVADAVAIGDRAVNSRRRHQQLIAGLHAQPV